MTTSLIKLETLAGKKLNSEMDGSLGIYREKTNPCLIPAENDFQAIEYWLKEYSKSVTTFRNYQKEGERLLLWSVIERQKPLSSLTGEDLLAYSLFLDNPQPSERWCGPKLAHNGKRWTKDWRPFVGPLGSSAKELAFKCIASLFNYLTESQYLTHNPLITIRRQVKHTYSLEERKLEVEKRIIDLDEWYLVQDILEALPESNDKEIWEKVRLRLLFALFYFAGLRNHEVPANKMSAFKKIRDVHTGKDRWWFYTIGKGGSLDKVPVNQSLLDALISYRRFLKLSDLPELNETEPLVKSFKNNKSIGTRRINQLIKSLTHKAAEYYEIEHPEKAARLKKFSAHWARHLHCSIQDRLNIPKQLIKENARHKNSQTTDIYIHAFDNQRHDEMEKVVWKPQFKTNNIVSVEEDN